MTSGKMRKAMDFLGYSLVLLVNVVMGWFSLPWIASVGWFESPVMRLPMWVVQSIIPIGCGLASLFCLLHMIRIISGTEKEESESC